MTLDISSIGLGNFFNKFDEFLNFLTEFTILHENINQNISIMALKIGKESKLAAYTLSQIMEREYSQLWNDSINANNKLVELQNGIITLLTLLKKQLQTSVGTATEYEALNSHIHARSLYVFAKTISDLLNDRCEKLSRDSSDYTEKCEAEDRLRQYIDLISKISIEELLQSNTNSLAKITSLIEEFSIPDLLVVYKTERGSWSFRDIEGQMQSEDKGTLLQDAIKDEDPSETNIKELLDSDKLSRLY